MREREEFTWKSIWGMFYPTIIYEVLSYLIPLVIIMALRIYIDGNITQNQKEAENILNQMYYSNVMQIMILVSLISIPIFALIMHLDKKKYIAMREVVVYYEYKMVNPLKYLLIIPLAVSSMIAFNMITSFAFLFLPNNMMEGYEVVEDILYSAPLPIQVMATVILAPIVEEILYRGVIYNRMKRVMNVKLAMILSSVYFGICHGNYVQGLYAFMIGMMFVFVYDKYKTIWAPMLFHISANGMAVMITAISDSVNTGEEVVEYTTTEMAAAYLYSIPSYVFAVIIFTVIICRVVKPKVKYSN